MKPRRIRRVGMAHRHEAKYASTRQTRQKVPITINAHDFLDYAHLRAQVAHFVASVFRKHPDSALVGFLTGSVGPTVNARMFIEGGLGVAHRVRYTSGLAHHDKNQSTEPEFYGILDDLYEMGVRHYIIVDEIVGGGSIRGALNSLRRWLGRRGHHDCIFHVVGVYERRRHTKVQAVITELRSAYGGMGLRQIAGYPTNKLLEMDKQGIKFRALKRGKSPGEYEFERERAERMAIKCPTGGVNQGMCSASSVDQLFGGMISMTIGEMPTLNKYVWPRSIRLHQCDECKRLFEKARKAYRPLRRKTVRTTFGTNQFRPTRKAN